MLSIRQKSLPFYAYYWNHKDINQIEWNIFKSLQIFKKNKITNQNNFTFKFIQSKNKTTSTSELLFLQITKRN